VTRFFFFLTSIAFAAGGCVKYVPVVAPSTPPKAPSECTAKPKALPKMKPFPRRKADGTAWTVPEINAKWVEHQIAVGAIKRMNDTQFAICAKFHMAGGVS